MRKRWKVCHYGQEQGVITVEACLALPVFLCFFFMLLYLCKVACILISLEQAAGQTARHLAAASYPLTFINEYIDDRMENTSIIQLAEPAAAKMVDLVSMELDLAENSLGAVLWGDLRDDLAAMLFKAFKNQVPADYYTGLDNLIKDAFLDQYENLTNGGKELLAAHLVNSYLDHKFVNPANVTIRLVELPKGQAEYEHRRSQALYRETGLLPDQDFGPDDVVVQLEYDLNIPLPFFRDRSAKLRATAIERAWLIGGNGVYTQEQEGLDWLKKSQRTEYVYKARTGRKYHPYKACAYLQKSCLTITKEEAEKLGLTKHQNCPNRF